MILCRALSYEENTLDKSLLSVPFWGSTLRNTALRIAGSLWTTATPAQTLTALRLLK